MLTKYPVLDNRPIYQLKVTELKEELKKRQLSTRGLKDDLIKRLHQALGDQREDSVDKEVRNEEDNVMKEEKYHKERDSNRDEEGIQSNKGSDSEELIHGSDCNSTEMTHDNVVVTNHKEKLPEQTDSNASMVCNEGSDNKELLHGSDCNSMVRTYDNVDIIKHEEKLPEQADSNASKVCIDGRSVKLDQERAELVTNTNVVEISVKENITMSQTVTTQISSTVDIQLETDGTKLIGEDHTINMSDQNNQVSGYQVMSSSIITDSVSINEKNELKDNLNTNNFHLELEVTKSEMVQKYSGDVHPMDEQEPHEKQTSSDKIADTSVSIFSNVDGASEKLNLDPSLEDDSVEKDTLVTKHMDPNLICSEARDQCKVVTTKEDSPFNVVGGNLPFENVVKFVDYDLHHGILPEKRKLEGNEAVLINQPPKRQRRWNPDSVEVSAQTSNLPPTTSGAKSQSSIPMRNFTQSDSTLSVGDAPKERVVPVSPRSPTTSLRINHFVRPFTLKAVQELLGNTGKVSSFWMDHIKTHCYVTYSSMEEAIATRNALYNLLWPSKGGRLLVAEFVDPQDVKTRIEPPSRASAASRLTSPTATLNISVPAENLPPPPPLFDSHTPRVRLLLPPPPSIFDPHTPRERLPLPPQLPLPPPITDLHTPRERLPLPIQLSPPPPMSDLRRSRERLPLPPPPHLKKSEAPVVLTLDDLFKKTRVTPRIYYLPLTEEQVALKLEADRNFKDDV